MSDTKLVDRLRSETDVMVEALGRLVDIESPTADLRGVRACAQEAAELGRRVLGFAPEWVDVGERPHLHWRFPRPEGDERPGVLLIGHLDTVWPLGTTARWPFSVDGDRATGPGIFDMKAGCVQAFYALAALERLDGVELLLTTDEELGSPTSRDLVEDAARRAAAAFVLEPSAGGAVKTARKGVSLYTIEFAGRAAHAGLEPEKGANALVSLSHTVLDLLAIARPDVGTSVTPTVATAGTTTNTVPAHAVVKVDVRAVTADEQQRVDDEIHALATKVPGTVLTVLGGPNRPPLQPSASAALYTDAVRLAAGLGMAPLSSIEVGGGSDGNFTAGVGTPTLDGLGAVGDHAHGEGEYIVVSAMAERAALVAALVEDVLTR